MSIKRLGQLFQLGLALISWGALCAQTVLREREGAGVIERAVIYPRGQLDRSSATILARQFLKRYGADHEIISILMGVDESEIRASLYSLSPTFTADPIASLDKYVEELRTLGPPKGPIARVLSINGDALFSYREGGAVYEEVLTGTDPTRLIVDDVKFQLLHLSFSEASSAVAEPSRYRLTLYFLAAPRISISRTITATRMMLSRLRIKNLAVLVRSDGWFFGSDDYPAYPAFIRNLTAPNANKYRLFGYTSCGFERGDNLTCSGRNFEP